MTDPITPSDVPPSLITDSRLASRRVGRANAFAILTVLLSLAAILAVVWMHRQEERLVVMDAVGGFHAAVLVPYRTEESFHRQLLTEAAIGILHRDHKGPSTDYINYGATEDGASSIRKRWDAWHRHFQVKKIAQTPRVLQWQVQQLEGQRLVIGAQIELVQVGETASGLADITRPVETVQLTWEKNPDVSTYYQRPYLLSSAVFLDHRRKDGLKQKSE